MNRLVTTAFTLLLAMASNAGAAITPANLALIVNDNDPQSVAVAAHYQKARRIPDANIIHVSFDSKKPAMSPADFAAIREQVEDQVAAEVQAYALSWTRPFKVGCMSSTSAFALGSIPPTVPRAASPPSR